MVLKLTLTSLCVIHFSQQMNVGDSNAVFPLNNYSDAEVQCLAYSHGPFYTRLNALTSLPSAAYVTVINFCN